MRCFSFLALASVLLLGGCGGDGGGGRHPAEHFYFFANDAPGEVRNWEMWRTDGTAEGTHRIRAASGPAGINNSTYMVYRTRRGAFFVADDGVHGQELWYTDGTDAGTRLTRDIHPDGDARIEYPKTMNNVLYFSAESPGSGIELWRSDGSTAGTYSLLDLAPGECSSWPRPLGVVGKWMYFRATAGCGGTVALWRTDGTAAGTQEVFGGGVTTPVAAVPGRLFFSVSTERGRELWVTGDTPDSTHPVTVAGETQPVLNGLDLWAVGNTVYFVASGRDEGRELYRTDASGRIAYRVSDIHAGPESAYPRSLISIGQQVFFFAGDTQGTGLWRTDGTEAGTVPLLRPGDLEADVFLGMDSLGDTLLITTQQGEAQALWISDGTPAGSSRLRADLALHDIASLTPFNGLVLFRARDGVHGRERWRTDGTDEGTFMLADTCPGPCDGSPL